MDKIERLYDSGKLLRVRKGRISNLLYQRLHWRRRAFTIAGTGFNPFVVPIMEEGSDAY